VCAVVDEKEHPLLATAGDDATVRLWNPATGTSIGQPMTGHDGPVTAMCAVPTVDGRTLLATGGTDATVRIWCPATGTALGIFQVGMSANALCALSDGSLAIATPEGIAVLLLN
jgi:WD40 repeat protein